MENTTMCKRGPVWTGDGYLMDARLRVPAPTPLPILGTTVFARGGAYRNIDVNSSASERPPV